MRYATVVGSAYEDSPRLAPLPSSILSARRMQQGLAHPQFGWRIDAMPANRGWPEALAATLESLPERPESILLSFHGYVAWVGDKEPSLLLSGPKPRAIPARRICSLLELWSDRVLVILDVVPVVDAGKPRGAIADALRSALDGLGVGVLVGARIDPELPTEESTTFGALVAEGLERIAQSLNGAPVMAKDLYREIVQARVDETLRIRYFASSQDFLVVPPRTPSASPPGESAARSSAVDAAAELNRARPSEQPRAAGQPSQAPLPSRPPPVVAVQSLVPSVPPAPASPVSTRPEPSQRPAVPSSVPAPWRQSEHSGPPPGGRVADSVSPAPSRTGSNFDPFAAAAQAYQQQFQGTPGEAGPSAQAGTLTAPRPPVIEAVVVHALAASSEPVPPSAAPGPPAASAAPDPLEEEEDPGLWLGASVGSYGAEDGGAAPWVFPSEPAVRLERDQRAPPRPMAPQAQPAPQVPSVVPTESAPPDGPLASGARAFFAGDALDSASRRRTPVIESADLETDSSSPAVLVAMDAWPRFSPDPQLDEPPPPPEILPIEISLDLVMAENGDLVPGEPSRDRPSGTSLEPTAELREAIPPAPPTLPSSVPSPSPREAPPPAGAEEPPPDSEVSSSDIRSVEPAPAQPPEAVAEPPREPEPPAPPTPEQVGDRLVAREELQAGLEQYRAVLSACPEDRVSDRVRVLVKIGDIERRLGQIEPALDHYSQAFSLDPLNLSALFWATEIFYERQEFHRVEEFLRRRLDQLTEPALRVEVLRALADLWLDQHRDLGRARQLLDQVLREQPDDQKALESLVELEHAQGDHEEAIRTQWWLASTYTDDRPRQAQLLLEAARAAHQHLGDLGYAVDLGEQALHADPKAYDVLEFVANLLVEREDWPHLAQSYAAVLELDCDEWVILDLCEKLAVLYRDKLGQPERSVSVLERAVKIDPSNIRLRSVLVEIHTGLGQRQQALTHCRAVIRDYPETASGYQAAYSVFTDLGGTEGARLAAAALDCLGVASEDQAHVCQAQRSEGLLPVKSVLREEDWESSLLWPEHDPEIRRLLNLVREVAIEHRLAVLEREKRLLALDPSMIQDPNTSTTMLSRSMLWTARLLGVPTPALYVYPTVPGELGATPAREPTVLASRTLGSGFKLAELAFLWARHLASLRGEHHLLLFFPTIGELAQLVTAAFVAGELTERSLEFFDPAVATLAQALAKGLGEAASAELGEVTAALGPAEAGTRMLRWAHGVELVSARVGLLASGDIGIAAELTRRFPVGSQTNPDQQRRDLLAFSLSEEYMELRRRLGVSLDQAEEG